MAPVNPAKTVQAVPPIVDRVVAMVCAQALTRRKPAVPAWPTAACAPFATTTRPAKLAKIASIAPAIAVRARQRAIQMEPVTQAKRVRTAQRIAGRAHQFATTMGRAMPARHAPIARPIAERVRRATLPRVQPICRFVSPVKRRAVIATFPQ